MMRFGIYRFSIYHLPLGSILRFSVFAVLAWGLLLFFVKKHVPIPKPLLWLPAAVSVYAVLRMTLLGRAAGDLQIELRPLYSLSPEKFHNETYRTLLMNAFLFLPFGMTVPFALPDKWQHKALAAIGLAAGLSIFCEAMQLLFRLGYCETDDVIMNTLGAACGTLSYLLYETLSKGKRNAND